MYEPPSLFSQVIASSPLTMYTLLPRIVRLVWLSNGQLNKVWMNSRKPLPTVTLNLTKSSTICRLSISLRSAKRLHAFVMVGYPQIVQGEDNSSPIYYNSACLVDRHGKLITTYQKRFLYQVDEAWAQEGPAFQSIYVEGLGKVKWNWFICSVISWRCLRL
jgi:hypothetical protein